MVKIRGAKELAVKLKKLPTNAKKILRRAMRSGTKIIQSKAKSNIQATDIPPANSGDLARSIKVRSMKRKRGRIGFRVTSRLAEGKKIYNMAQEYGWTSSKGRAIQGKHYMQLAGESEHDKCLAIINDAVDDAIRSTF